MKTLFNIFLFFKENRMPQLFNSCAVSQNKGRVQSFSLWGFDEYISSHSVDSVCCCRLRCILRAGVACTPWVGLYSERQQSSMMAGGHFFFSPWTAKNMRGAETPLCSRERGRGKKKESLSFIIQMKWGPADGGRGAVGLRQKTSCSLPLWFQSARDEIKSSKGISDRDGSH